MKQTNHWKAPQVISEAEETKAGGSAPKSFGGLRISLIKTGGFIVFAGFCLFLLLLEATISWWVLLLLALPAYLFLEWFGERVFSEKYGWSTSQVGFSPLRIITGVVLVLAVFGVVYSLWRWAS